MRVKLHNHNNDFEDAYHALGTYEASLVQDQLHTTASNSRHCFDCSLGVVQGRPPTVKTLPCPEAMQCHQAA